MQSPALRMFLSSFKAAAAEGAAFELKMLLLAGSIPAAGLNVTVKNFRKVHGNLLAHFNHILCDEDKEILDLCLYIRNKLLHADFYSLRQKLNSLIIASETGNVMKIDLTDVSRAEIMSKLEAVKSGKLGIRVADTESTVAGTIYGWFMEAGNAGDFEKSAYLFQRATEIIDRLVNLNCSEITEKASNQ